MLYEKDLKIIDRFIGKRIRVLRITRNMSSNSLAILLRMTEEQLLRYESGSDRISANELTNIAKLLRESINFFFPD